MAKQVTDHTKFDVESRTIIRILALVGAAVLLVIFLKNIIHPLVLLFTSFFLALALNPVVSAISSRLKKESRALATGVAYILVLAVLITFIALVIPPLVKQTFDFIKQVPDSISQFQRSDSAVNSFIHKYNLNEQVNKFNDDLGGRVGDLSRPALSTAGTVFATVINTITVLVLTFMMLVEGPIWLDKFWAIQDKAKRGHRKKLAKRMYKVVTNYVNGQVLIALIDGLFATVALFILSQIFDADINAIALGGIIALFALLPLVGTIIGSVIVVLACLLVSLPLAIAAAVYFVIYQQIENVTLQPLIQSRGNNLTPLIVFTAAIIGGGFGGILGAFVAIPVAGCIKILVEDYFEHRGIKPVKPVSEN